jgi:protein tyrosine/serine phosphatase
MKQAKRTTRWRVAAVAVVAVVGAAVAAGIVGRDYLLAKRFAVVEPGSLYRSGYNEPGPLRRILGDHGIRHILCLANYPADSPRGRKEHAVAAEQGATVTVLPMPGNGCAPFEVLDEAADFLADPANRPLLVHCAAGVQRTNAALIAYRLKYRGWSLDRALADAEAYWLDRDENPQLYRHLARYAAYLARNASTATAPAPTAPARTHTPPTASPTTQTTR